MKKLTSHLAAATVFCALPVMAETKLSVADAFPVGHYVAVQAGDFWMNKVTELTEGEVQFDHFTSGQLGKLTELLDATRDGVSSIAYIPMSSYSSRLPLAGVAELPGLFETSVRGTRAFNKLLEDDGVRAEFAEENVVPLFGAVLPPYQIASAKGSIQSDGDFKAIRLRTPGGILELAASQLGAVAIPMGGPDMYSAFQRGTVDATLNSYSSLNSYKLLEVINAASTNGSFGSFAFVYAINKDQFENLAEEQQKSLLKAGQLASENFAKWMDANESEIAKAFAAKGVNTYAIEQAQLEKWNASMSAVGDDWASRLDERGLAGSETLAAWKQALSETK